MKTQIDFTSSLLLATGTVTDLFPTLDALGQEATVVKAAEQKNLKEPADQAPELAAEDVCEAPIVGGGGRLAFSGKDLCLGGTVNLRCVRNVLPAK